MNDTELRKYKARAYARKYRYGITDEQYNELLKKQDNSCAVCKVSFVSNVPNIDHDHNCCPGTKSCGKCLRGLLCSNCITMASLVETKFKYINDMFEYLTGYLHVRHGKEV